MCRVGQRLCLHTHERSKRRSFDSSTRSSRQCSRTNTEFRDCTGIVASRRSGIAVKYLIPLLAPVGCFFVLSLILLTLLQRALKKTGNSTAASRLMWLQQATIMLTWISVGIATASAVAMTESTSALQFVTNHGSGADALMNAGTMLQSLQWIIVSLSILYSLGVSSMFRTVGGSFGGVQTKGLPDMEGMGLVPPPMPPLPPL